MPNNPDNLLRRFGRRVMSGNLRKPPSQGALAELSKDRMPSRSNGSITSMLIRGSKTDQHTSLPNPPLWASIIVFTVNMLSLVGIAALGPTIMPPKHPGDAIKYVTAAIPFFVLQMAVENLVIWAAGIAEHSPAAAYDLSDAWSSANSGFVQQLFSKIVLGPIAQGACYIYVYNLTADLPLPRPQMDSWLHVAALFLLVDFCYYWLHRSAHVSPVLWLGHSVHHDSEHYNNSTALRQGALQAVTSWVFSLPLALVFPPRFFLTYSQANTLYQFWIHTCCIRRLGLLEYVMMTPSHHRVHHDRRVHKNFGGVLIVWDRLFGSFLDELAVPAAAPKAPKAASIAPDTADANRRTAKFYLGGPDAVPSAPAPLAPAPRAEKCYFGQKRAPTSWIASVTQHQEPGTLLGRLAASASTNAVLQTLMKGPGYYTAGMRRRNALPGKSSTLNRFRLVSNPAPLRDLSAYHMAVHTLIIWASLARLLVDSKSSPAQLVLQAALPLVSLMSQGVFLDGGPEGVSVERARCITMALATGYQLCGAAGAMPPAELSTWMSWLGAVLAANTCSALGMLVAPARFQRVLLKSR